MKTINKLWFAASALLLLSACSKDFLETAPTSSVGTANVFASTEMVKMAVNGIAYNMTVQQGPYSQGCCGENRIISIYNEYPSQEFVYNGMAAGWAPIMNQEFYTRFDTSYCSYPWFYYYKIISNANAIIANAEGAAGSEAEKSFYKAQALTYRAWAYTKLLELYSVRWQDSENGAKDGVVLRLDESTGSIPLSSMADCYKQIYKDLDDAIAAFKASGLDRPAGEVWLTNLNVAYAIYAKAALNRQDYATALTNAKLAQDGYPLMSNADYASGFNKPTSEWIFGSFGDGSENMWYWTFGTQFSCNGYYANNSKYGGGAIEKACTDQIPNTDIRKELFLTEDKLAPYDIYDPANVNQTEGFCVGDDIRTLAATYVASRTPAGVAAAYQTGYFHIGAQLKFWVFDTPGVMYLPYIRTSEMVLIEAEANYFLNKPADAQAALVKLNKESGRDASYACTKTGDALFNEIVLYRELELWGEGFNWHDYKRWKKDIVRKSFAAGGNFHTATAVTIKATDSNWTWSIPETETQYNSEVEHK
ncbi:MAG: RagB/SusD family nutrient uptake outer membrane protein [Bacteroidales bacterium]|nr:RagB/SusD family nutrient uptake outer membrane protein [Bacteroidales bacterium]